MKHKYIHTNKWDEILIPALVFFVLITTAYTASLWNPLMIDDIPGVRNNPHIGDPSHLFDSPFNSFRALLLLVSYKAAGFTPAAYRIFNILFHYGSTLMLFLTIKRLTDRRLAWFSALVFAVHPILSESVVWISAVIYPQYAFFFMLSLYCYIRNAQKPNVRWFAASIVAAFFSHLSSEKALALPLILTTLEFAYFTPKKNWKRLILFYVIMFMFLLSPLLDLVPRTEIMAHSYQAPIEVYNPLVHAPFSTTSYIQLILIPDHYSLYHSTIKVGLWELIIRFTIFALLVFLFVRSWKKNRDIFFWSIFFILALLPTFIPINILWMVAERYAYLATMGAITVIVYPLYYFSKNEKYSEYVNGALCLIILLLLIRTILRTFDWQNYDSFWMATVKANPTSSVAHNNVAKVYAEHKAYKHAITELRYAILLDPQFVDAHFNLGQIYEITGQDGRAQRSYINAVKYKPDYWEAYLRLGVLYYRDKEYEKSKDSFEAAMKIRPDNPLIKQTYENLFKNSVKK